MSDSSIQSLGTLLSTNSGRTTNAALQNTNADNNAFSEALLQQLTQQWMASLLSSLPVPGMDTGSSLTDNSLTAASSLGSGAMIPTTGQGGLNGLSSAQFLQLWAAAQSAGLTGESTQPSPATTLPGNLPTSTPSSGAIDSIVSSAVNAASQKYGVPESLIQSVIQQESGMDPQAHSAAGAIGLMQLMPETAASLGVNPWDPAQNIDGGTRYLAQLLSEFHGNTALAVAAYNAGPGAVHAYGGIPPYEETQTYVQRVLQGASSLGNQV